MSGYLGDFSVGANVDCKFTTRRFSTGAPFTLAGTPAVAAYADNSTTEITTGITLTTDFDARTGLNHVRVVATSGNGYVAGSSYDLVITAGTVDSISVVGEVIGSFSLERSAAFSRLGAPAGASISADIAGVQSDTNDIQARLPAALVSGRIDASVGAMAANTLTASAIAADAITDAKVASDVTIASVTGSVGSVTAAVTVGTINANVITATSIAADAITDAKVASDVTIASVTGAVGSVTAAVTVGTINANVVNASALATDAVAEIADQVWDEALSGHLSAGSTGAALNGAGSAGDPWATALPGAYGAGTAGNILGNNLDAAVSTRATPAQVNAEADTALADVGLTTTVTGRIDATISSRLATSGYTAPPTVGAIADQVWDETLADHLTAGSTGNALNAAGAAGDPWTTALPGAYGAGSAGNIVGNNLNATVGSRATQASVDTIDDFLDTEITTILQAVDTEVAAIKAKTDNLPASPAAAGDAMTLTSGERDAVAAAALDLANSIEAGLTLRQALRLIAAACAGKASGLATTTATYRNAVADSKNRIVATVDADGNRTAITTDLT